MIVTNSKLADFAAYRRLRGIGDYTPPWRKSLRPAILARRKEKIAELEAAYPDFKETYNRLESR